MRSLPPFLVSIGLLLTFCSCSSSSQQQQLGQNSKGTDVLNGKSSSISFPVSYPAEVDSNQFQPEKVAESQFVLENQTFVLKNSAHQYTYQFTFQLNSTSVSKKLIGFQKADNTVNVKLGSSLHAFDKSQHNKNSRDHFLYKLQANEETTFRMLYIAPYKELKNNLYLEVNPSGTYGNHSPAEDYEAKRFIRLNLS